MAQTLSPNGSAAKGPCLVASRHAHLWLCEKLSHRTLCFGTLRRYVGMARRYMGKSAIVALGYWNDAEGSLWGNIESQETGALSPGSPALIIASQIDHQAGRP